MAVNLQKGQRVNLTKSSPRLAEIIVSMDWDPVQSSGGLFGTLFGSGDAPNIDCDISVIMLGKNNRLLHNNDVIYFGNLSNSDGSVQHSGDNLTGDGDGDDELIKVDLTKVPLHIQKLVFVANIYDSQTRKQHFGMIGHACLKIVDTQTNQELVHYNLTDHYEGKTSLIAGEIYRDDDEWKFTAIGEGTKAVTLSELVQSYG